MKMGGLRSGGVLRGIQSPETPYPSNNHSQKSRTSRSSKENMPPDTNAQSEISGKPMVKKSPLPPRPPSSNPNPNSLKRKLCVESAPENGVTVSSDSGVKVIVRMRPLSNDEEEGEKIVQKISPCSLSVLDQVFTFDSVAGTDSTQVDIFQLVGIPLVENCLAGFNSSIFAYGQTGSGKTYTMWGPANALVNEHSPGIQQGLTPRVFECLFARIQEEQVKHSDKQLNYQLRCSFLEIYNEQITDLLDPNGRNLQIREDVKSGVYVENLTEELVCTMKDVTHLLTKGLANRRVGATSINAESSRSHSVFTCVVESRCKCMADGLSSLRTSRINLVDLAGSERQKLTGAAGERLKEAGNINRSLSQLGNLINILAEVSQTGKQRHIPYRDSRLTFLLQESLGGNAKLAMICAISPAQSCKSETLSTLRFAQRAKAIQNKAVVNETTEDDVNVLREQIRQLKDELIRMKSNGGNSPGDGNGGYSTGWNARRSLNLLRLSLSRPLTLPHVENDSDEEMEIDENDVEKPSSSIQPISYNFVGTLPVISEETQNDLKQAVSKSSDSSTKSVLSDSLTNGCISEQGSEENDVTMEDTQTEEIAIAQQEKYLAMDTQNEPAESQHYTKPNIPDPSVSVLPNSENGLMLNGDSCKDLVVVDPQNNSSPSTPNSTMSNLSIVPSPVSPILQSPTPSLSPRVVSESRKSLRRSANLSPLNESPSVAQPVSSTPANGPSTQMSKNFVMAPTEALAASLQRGLQVIDNHQQTSGLRRSMFRFSVKALDLKPFQAADKVDAGVQTLPDEPVGSQDFSVLLCSSCKCRTALTLNEVRDDNTEMQLVPVDGSQITEASKNQVPKAVEKVLAGAIRREMALEEFCGKQAAEIQQLNRLVQQYKHERECNAIIEQTREDKILRLEGLMDGVLPAEEFMEEEFLSLTNEHRLLKGKYDNHPEVLRANIELKRLQEELDEYRNFFDLGEREVLMEEVHHLRNQLQSYIDSSSQVSTRNWGRSPPLQLTHTSQSASLPLSTTPNSPASIGPLSTITGSLLENNLEEKLQQEREKWIERESEWISLSEELRLDLEASRRLAEKRELELNAEKKCSEELKEALQTAMEGHARILDQYADLQEKHIALLARHRKIREGISDVKKAAAKAGVKGAESRFIDTLAAEISALKVEKERERQYLRDENKGLQAQLRDTAEAVQAAGELLVRLKEAEEAVLVAQERGVAAEKEVEKLKKKHSKEIAALNQFLAESKLPKSALRPPTIYKDSYSERPKFDDGGDTKSFGDRGWKEEFEMFTYEGEDRPSAWYNGYDSCNI
ncbi:hypothetical protein AMTRI_Chr06g172520 [Amborella trichopoda]